MWEHGGLSRWSNGIRTSSTSLFQDISPSERIIWESFSLEPSMGISIIVSSPTRIQHVWNFPGKGKTKWTRSVDEGGRSLRMDNSKGESIFTKGMTQGLWQKKRDEQTGTPVLESYVGVLAGFPPGQYALIPHQYSSKYDSCPRCLT